MAAAKVTSKGQITIPAEVRKVLNLRAGDKVDFFEIEKGRYGMAARNKSIRDLEGCVPKLDRAPTIEELNEAIGAGLAEDDRQSINRSSKRSSKNEAA